MLKAVIFDMDGVLIDSEPLHAKAAVCALHELGVDITLEYAYQFIGNTTLYMLETIERDFHLDISAQELLSHYKKWERKLSAEDGYPPIPFVKELIMDLYHNGVKLAIASSSPIEAIHETAEQLGVTQYFSKLISGMSVPHSKPHPDIFLKAASELGVSTDECMIIEDSMNGTLAGVRANIPVIGFVNPHSGNQDLSKACILVEGFEEVDYSFIRNTYLHAHNMPITIATTKHLIIRELTKEDSTNLYELYKNPAFLGTDITPFANSLEETEEKLDAYVKYMYQFHNFGLWGVFDQSTNALIGHCGIEPKEIQKGDTTETVFELSYALKDSEQQKGYGYETCQAILTYTKNSLFLPKLTVLTSKTNTPSKQLAKKLGFSYTDNVSRKVNDTLMQCERYEIEF